jgi:hypothetical protein
MRAEEGECPQNPSFIMFLGFMISLSSIVAYEPRYSMNVTLISCPRGLFASGEISSVEKLLIGVVAARSLPLVLISGIAGERNSLGETSSSSKIRF